MRKHQFLLFRVYRFHDAAAYDKLYLIYKDQIKRFITFKVPRDQDADELTSEVFLRAWEYSTSNRVENIGALYYRIARNVIADFYRKRKLEEPLDMAVNVHTGEELVERLSIQEDYQGLLVKIQTLKDDHKTILSMRFFDEMSITEIAEIMEKTPNNVRVLLHRAKKALKEISDK